MKPVYLYIRHSAEAPHAIAALSLANTMNTAIHFMYSMASLNNLSQRSQQYIVDLLVRHNPSRRLRSRDGNFLVIPSARTTHYGERWFSYAARVAWNNLPREIRFTSMSLSQFKKSLKTHRYLFNIAFAT